ncbi:DUF3040 domain-containing protein [Saccharopolyspora sp. ID03-671]|uniref:DUF3040 domain-containing protein n=1 Tax=Saccharopolyspora sp. ID03-671 TaxID=3073066 RepID=UPI0032526949
MLSKHERDRLAEIESALASADPVLAEKFERFEGGPSTGALSRALICTALALTAMLSLLSLASGLVWTSAALGAITAAGVIAAGVTSRRHRET